MVDSYFEKGVKLNGTLWCKGSVHFEGEFEGDIHSTNNFVMGKNGNLRGNIKSLNFINQGTIEGNVHADNKLELAAGSRLVGDISTFHLVIGEGSNFEGRCKMIDGPPVDKGKDPVKPPEVSKADQKEKKTGFWGKMTCLIVVLALLGGLVYVKFPDFVRGILPNEADYLVGQGNSFLTKSRYEEAEVQFRNALRLSRSNAAVHAGLGEVYLSRNNFSDAEVQFKRAAELKPLNGEFRVKLAMIYSKLGQFVNAESAYKQALKLTPNDPAIFYNLAVLYKERGALDSAIEFIRKAADLQKGDLESRRILSELLLQSGKFDEAIRELKLSLEMDESDPVLHLTMGEALMKNGERASAIKEFKRAENLFPKNFEAEIRKADWYFQKTLFEESLNAYRAESLLKETFPDSQQKQITSSRTGNL